MDPSSLQLESLDSKVCLDNQWSRILKKLSREESILLGVNVSRSFKILFDGWDCLDDSLQSKI